MPKYNYQYEIITTEGKENVTGTRTALGQHLEYVAYKRMSDRSGYGLTYLPTGHSLNTPWLQTTRLRHAQQTALWIDKRVKELAQMHGPERLTDVLLVTSYLRRAWEQTYGGQTVYTEEDAKS